MLLLMLLLLLLLAAGLPAAADRPPGARPIGGHRW
jgi:hypothetical protein